MQIEELKLLNFRNYEKVLVSFDKNLNIIYGNNGSGKTNLVEAIYFLALTRSFKQTNLNILIRDNTNLTKVEGVIKNKYRNTYKVMFDNDTKTIKIDQNKIDKISDYIGKINIVLFNPSDLKMIKDAPSVRRKYLNILVSQLYASYLQNLNQYNKLIKVRNAYLKKMYLNGNSLMTYLDVVTEKVVDLGMEIYKIRKECIDKLNDYIGNIYQRIAGTGSLKIEYISDFDSKSKNELINIYKKNVSKDIKFGKTSFGVHHDDFIILLNNKQIKDYGSEGQQKNAVIAWKFSEIEIFKSIKESVPILILDDLLSELDKEKIKNILSFVSNDIQTFITITEIEKIENLISNKEYKKINVLDGKIEEVD